MTTFRETFKASQQYKDLVQQIVDQSGKPSVNGTFPAYTREQAEEMVSGWINSFEALDLLAKKGF